MLQAQYVVWNGGEGQSLACTLVIDTCVRGFTSITDSDIIGIGHIMDKGFTLVGALGRHFEWVTVEHMTDTLAEHEAFAELHGVTFEFTEPLSDDEFYALVRTAHVNVRKAQLEADLAEFREQVAAAAHMDDCEYDVNPWDDHDALRHERVEEALRTLEFGDEFVIREQPSQAQIDALFGTSRDREPFSMSMED